MPNRESGIEGDDGTIDDGRDLFREPLRQPTEGAWRGRRQDRAAYETEAAWQGSALRGEDSGDAGTSGADAPLADRMRPRTLDSLVGQQDVLGEGGFLREAIEADIIPSVILWGPPGCGKTSLARIIAERTMSVFVPFSAVMSGVREVRAIAASAVERLQSGGRRTILFIDEIHRFNKAQQDAFLPHVESGAITLVGATTEIRISRSIRRFFPGVASSGWRRCPNRKCCCLPGARLAIRSTGSGRMTSRFRTNAAGPRPGLGRRWPQDAEPAGGMFPAMPSGAVPVWLTRP